MVLVAASNVAGGHSFFMVIKLAIPNFSRTSKTDNLFHGRHQLDLHAGVDGSPVAMGLHAARLHGRQHADLHAGVDGSTAA